MGKYQNDLMLDAALNYIKTNADGGSMVVLASSATLYAHVTASALASATTASGDWTVGDGDTSGRKVTYVGASGVTVATTGTANHLALTDGSGTLYYVTTVTSQALTATNTLTIPTFDIEISDAT